MLTEREVMAAERIRDKLRDFKGQLSAAQSTLNSIITADTDLPGDSEFDLECMGDQLTDFRDFVEDAITQLTEAIEEYDEST